MRHKSTILGGVAAVMAAPLLLGSILIFTSVAGYRAQIILSDSMRPALSAGSLVIIRRLPAWQYHQADIVSFIPPVRNGGSITHRIVRLYQSGGVPVMQTKGDGNALADIWVTGTGAITGTKVLAVPYVGYAFQLIRTPAGFFIAVSLTFLLFIYKEVRFLVEAFRSLFITSRNETAA